MNKKYGVRVTYAQALGVSKVMEEAELADTDDARAAHIKAVEAKYAPGAKNGMVHVMLIERAR